MKSSTLFKLLKPPAQIANSLDWKKASTTVATLHIGRDRIGMAIGSHPDVGEEVTTVEPLELALVTKSGNRRVLARSCIDEFRTLCDDHNVGSFLVWWPLQREGRAGARCGKVLHTLESLLAESKTILTPNRPIALWTVHVDREQQEKYAEDNWGRCSMYSRCVYDKTFHRASAEQYCHARGSSQFAAETWDEFCKHFWPNTAVIHQVDKQKRRKGWHDATKTAHLARMVA